MLLAARHYCGVGSLDDLSADQTRDLLDRLRARYGDAPAGDAAVGRQRLGRLGARLGRTEPEVRVSTAPQAA